MRLEGWCNGCCCGPEVRGWYYWGEVSGTAGGRDGKLERLVLRVGCRVLVDVMKKQKNKEVVPFCLRVTRYHNNRSEITYAESADSLALGVLGGVPHLWLAAWQSRLQ